jgi:hypothetical protein
VAPNARTAHVLVAQQHGVLVARQAADQVMDAPDAERVELGPVAWLKCVTRQVAHPRLGCQLPQIRAQLVPQLARQLVPTGAELAGDENQARSGLP